MTYNWNTYWFPKIGRTYKLYLSKCNLVQMRRIVHWMWWARLECETPTSPGLAGPFARSECLPSAGKAGCSLADSPGKSPSGLPGSRPHWNLPGESAYPLRGKLRPARPEKSSRSSRPHGSLRAESKPLWYTLTLFNWNGCAVLQLWWNEMQILYNWQMLKKVTNNRFAVFRLHN